MQSTLDYAEVAARIKKFIKDQLDDSKLDGVIFGLSGGIDSAVTAHLCAGAVGSKKCLALIMPNDDFTPSSETHDGTLVADKLAVPHKTIPITAISNVITQNDSAESFGINTIKKTVGNLNSRIRTILLYYEAQKRNYLVVGTDDRSEHLIGYFTKYGDGACDILPIAGLYKTQVWELAKFLDVPSHIISKEPGAHLWRDHNASDEIGMDYHTIDAILQMMQSDKTAFESSDNIPKNKIDRILNLHRITEHKRNLPPVADPFEDGGITPVKNVRPWGYFETFLMNKTSTVKMIHVDPDSSLSLQFHRHRSEFWRVVYGSAIITLDGKTAPLEIGDDVFIPTNSVHRLTGGPQGARILEIALGNFSEGDIVRLEDGWGRK